MYLTNYIRWVKFKYLPKSPYLQVLHKSSFHLKHAIYYTYTYVGSQSGNTYKYIG